MRRAVQDYRMIEDGDRIFVGLSGGKDSTLLLRALADYRRFSPERYTLEAITIDMGLKDTDKSQMQALSDYCASLSVPHHIVKTDIAEIIFDARKESNPCSLCAKMRRGALNNEINRLGGGKLALGHNADDVAETMLLSLLYEGGLYGQIGRFPHSPLYISRGIRHKIRRKTPRTAHCGQSLPYESRIATRVCEEPHKNRLQRHTVCKATHFGRNISPRTQQSVAQADGFDVIEQKRHLLSMITSRKSHRKPKRRKTYRQNA